MKVLVGNICKGNNLWVVEYVNYDEVVKSLLNTQICNDNVY